MAYVQRSEGRISGVYTNPQLGYAEEWCDDGNEEVIAFLASVTPIEDISRRQFFQQLAIEGAITEAEALAAVANGAIPEALSNMIVQLPQDQRFTARMLICGATMFERRHQMTALIGSMYGWDSAQLDNFWQNAALL